MGVLYAKRYKLKIVLLFSHIIDLRQGDLQAFQCVPHSKTETAQGFAHCLWFSLYRVFGEGDLHGTILRIRGVRGNESLCATS